MSCLRLYLLRSPCIEVDDVAVQVDTRKAIALLAYLAITGGRHRRDALANLLWPELDQSHGRTALRRTLYALRKALAGDWLEVDRETIGLDPGADVWLDVDRFHRHLAECLTHGHSAGEVCHACVAPLGAAAELYSADFLAGFSLRDSLNFDDWQFFQAEALRGEFAHVLERLVRCHSAQGAFDSALAYARRWLALDALNEASHCHLMCLYAWLGQRTAAMRQYQACVQVLEDELGTQPQARTTALYEAISQGRPPQPPEALVGPENTVPVGTVEPVQVGTMLQNRYRLDAELGRGNLGVVYRARDTLLERDVAVKVVLTRALGAGGRARLAQEARAAAKLNHPNIVAVHDVGGLDDAASVAFIVMELVNGPALSECRPPTLEETIRIGRELCAALEHAHAHGIIHRDVKPENVLLTPDGTAKLMDFGLARPLASRITSDGAIVGTIFYLAPEQAMGEELDGRADLYALGVMLYELTTGRLPFASDDPLAVISQHLHAPVVPPRTHSDTIPLELDALIVRLLSKHPADRPASASEVLQALVSLERPVVRPVVDTPAPAVLPPLGSGREATVAGKGVFVARERELARLARHLDLALAGQGQIVFVTGGPGRGKTALMNEFAWQAHEHKQDLIFAAGNCNAHTGFGDPYLPFREILALLTGDVDALWAAGAIAGDYARRLWDAFPLVIRALVELGPDLVGAFVPGAPLARRGAAYVSGELRDRVPWLAGLDELMAHKAAFPHDPNMQQSALFEQYARVLAALARERPLLLTLDDLQWADAGSISLLFHLGRRLTGERVLIVGAYRPEEVALGRPSPVTAERERHPLEPVVHELQRAFGDILIDLRQSRDRLFVERYLESIPNRLSDAFRETLYRRTRGHPLFTVELLRGMQERGDLLQDDAGRWVEGTALDWETLPARVEAVIAERIDRLDRPSREALDTASVEGETFTAEVVARVASADEDEIVRRLSAELDRRHRLVRAQEMQRLGVRRLSRYRFQHSLYQNYLYQSLDPVARAHLHDAVGTALETLYGEETDEIAGSLARHFQEAGSADKAIGYLLVAAERARQSWANAEAIAHLNRGLELVKALPKTAERTRRELDLLVALGVPLVLTKGHAAPEVERTYARARELSAQVGDRSQHFQVLVGLRRFYLHRAELETARELGEQLLTLAQGLGNACISRAHMLHGEALYRMGRFAEAHEDFARGIAAPDPQRRGSDAHLFGNDSKVLGQVFEANVLWQLGYPDQALQIGLAGLTRAEKLAHPFTHACALYFTAMVHHLRGEAQTARDRLATLLAMCEEQGFALYSAWGTILLGQTLVKQNEVQAGMAQLRTGISALQALGFKLMLPEAFGFLAGGCAKAGELAEGLRLLTEALELAERTGERSWEAELHRLKGELLLMQGAGYEEAEACFERALEIARKQNARSWELRAAMSLSRLWQNEGRGAQARELLGRAYGWFSEGFETADLQEARALIAGMKHGL